MMISTAKNLGSFNTSKHLLANYTNNKKIDIACVSESFEHNDNLKMYGWEFLSKPRPARTDEKNPHGGVAIFTKVSVKVKPGKLLNLNCPDIEMVCCETMADNTKFLLVCVYILTTAEMTKLCKWMEQLDSTRYPNVMICGDFNAHHTHWDSNYRSKTNLIGDTKGKILFECISNNNFQVRNDKRPTCKQGNHIIDLVITRGFQNKDIQCSTETNAVLSTIHHPVNTRIGNPLNRKFQKLDLKKTSDEDLKQWKQQLKEGLIRWETTIEPTTENLDATTETLLEIVDRSIKENFKTKTVSSYSKFWMTEAIKAAVQKFHQCKRR